MKNIRNLFLLFVFVFCGCIDITQNIAIRKDGSGTVALTCLIPERTISQMRTMQKLKKEMIRVAGIGNPSTKLRAGAEGSGTRGAVREDEIVSRHFDLLFDPVEERIRKELKQYEKNGVFVESMRISVRNARRIVKINLRFRNLAKAAESDLFKAHWPFTLSRTAEGHYQFRGRIGMGGKSSMSSSKPETMKSLAPILSEFKAVLKVGVPGKIIRTNASRKSDSLAIWVYDFNKNQNAFYAFRNCHMNVLFTGKGLDLPEVMATKSSKRD